MYYVKTQSSKIKVLFVSGESKQFGIIPFIKSQADSLIANGVEVDHFVIKGGRMSGYIKNIPTLRKQLSQNSYDIIHAHFVYSAVVSLLTFRRIPILVSLMGSDVGLPYT